MSRRWICVFLVTIPILLTICALSVANAAYARSESQELSSINMDLRTSNDLLQTENNKLREVVASIQQYSIHSVEVTDMQQEQNCYIVSLFEENPIDSYFDSMAQKFEPTSTAEMSEFAYLQCAAWKAEMVNCYEILADIAKAKSVRNCIDEEKNSYIEYVDANTELRIYLTLSNAFDGGEDIFVGSLGNVVQPSSLSEAYKNKTVELFDWLYEIGSTPEFIFSEEEYNKLLQEAYPEK